MTATEYLAVMISRCAARRLTPRALGRARGRDTRAAAAARQQNVVIPRIIFWVQVLRAKSKCDEKDRDG